MGVPPTAAGIRRREFLRGAATAGSLAGASGLLSACGGLAGSERSGGTGGTTIRIAHITPQTGPLAGFSEPDAYLLDVGPVAELAAKADGHGIVRRDDLTLEVG